MYTVNYRQSHTHTYTHREQNRAQHGTTQMVCEKVTEKDRHLLSISIFLSVCSINSNSLIFMLLFVRISIFLHGFTRGVFTERVYFLFCGIEREKNIKK